MLRPFRSPDDDDARRGARRRTTPGRSTAVRSTPGRSTPRRRTPRRGHPRRRGLAVLAAGAALALVASGCSSANSVNVQHNKAGGGSGGYKYTIDVITHGGAGDSFWSIVKAGAQQAGKDMGDTVNYQSNGDPTQQAQLINNAVSQKPDGIVVSMANPPALQAAVRNAVSKGIPVIVINSGEQQALPYGALTYIGSDETIAGEAVGKQLKTEGAKNVVCVIQEAGNVSLENRCAGVKSGLGGGKVTNIQVDNNNLAGAQSIIQAKLQADPSVDAVVTLGAQVAGSAEQAISAARSKAKLATFDLNADVAKGVIDGKILFAVDQQPFLQGYLAVTMLTQYKANLNVLGGGQPVLTGPTLVTKKNAQQILKLAAAGTR